MWGDRDYTVDLISAVKLNRKLSGSELIVLPGGGHAVFEETPEQANRIVLEWLDRHPLPTPRRRDMPQAVPVAGTTAELPHEAFISRELKQFPEQASKSPFTPGMLSTH